MIESTEEIFKNYKYLYNYRKRLKQLLVSYKGGKCEICGYDKCISALEFHHKNPKDKDFSISSGKYLSIQKCKQEVDKCILVCSNCHRELHDIEYQKIQSQLINKEKQAFIEIMNNRDKYSIKHVPNSYLYLKDTNILVDIENNMSRKDIFKKYHINNRTFNRFLKENNITYKPKKIIRNKPTKQELLKLLENNSKSGIGRMFGVTCNAVSKWCKKYEI